jgi:ankyrin repeat protein
MLNIRLLNHQGNTPLHLAMDSAHAEAAVLLIEAGADRSRVSDLCLLNILRAYRVM